MAKEKWTTDEIGDLSGKLAIVTGANTGLGKQTSTVLASKNVEVIMAVRNIAKGEAAKKNILQNYPTASIRIMELDLSSLESIKLFARKALAELQRLDILINNAGVMVPPYGKTIDGFELQFGTNHIGHFALTGQLLPLLKKTIGARVVTVSSGAHQLGNLNFNDLGWENRKYDAWRAYGDSKIANLYFTYKLAEMLADTNVSAIAAHPGWTATDLQRHSGLFGFLNPFLAQKIEMGALPSLRAALDPKAENGDYFGPGGFMEIRGYPVKVSSNKLSKDKNIAQQLWNVSEELSSVLYR